MPCIICVFVNTLVTVVLFVTGAEKVGMPGISHGLISRGPIELVEFFNNSANDDLADELAAQQDSE